MKPIYPLPHDVLEELDDAAAPPTAPEAYTAALKFLHDIDDDDLLDDRLVIGTDNTCGISLEWPHYRLYFTICGDLTCRVHINENGGQTLSVDEATHWVVAFLRVCVEKHAPNDEYRKELR